jgi:hypothetical protein
MPEAELDLRLHRLLFFSDGVYAIAVTLLAVELILPEASAELHGRELLRSLLESWPRVLAFLTSFSFIANFWAAHNVLFHRAPPSRTSPRARYRRPRGTRRCLSFPVSPSPRRACTAVHFEVAGPDLG